MHMIGSGQFTDQRVLIIDKDQKNKNDRTWCFWEKSDGIFQPVVHKEWKELSFFSHGFQKKFSTHPYKYKMVRGVDFYRYCHAEIGRHPNFQMRTSEITGIFSDQEKTGVELSNGDTYFCKKIFSSVLPEPPAAEGKTWLLQHFKGWVVETPDKAFDPQSATMMDFRTAQENGATFCYVLPLSDRKALVEYTIFSENVLDKEVYDMKLKEYIGNVLGIGAYRICEEEFGVIPMTDHSFKTEERNVVYIGTAGGQTKGSTGYTFNFIQKHSREIVNALTGKGEVAKTKRRHLFYDSVLLGVLENKLVPGEEVFTKMFRHNQPAAIFRFLDNESSLAEEIGIIRTLPTLPFLKAAVSKIL